eukprot:366503-Chlamydomonas_euryale.AAC.13
MLCSLCSLSPDPLVPDPLVNAVTSPDTLLDALRRSRDHSLPLTPYRTQRTGRIISPSADLLDAAQSVCVIASPQNPEP